MPSSLERELMGFLGAHHGVAILHWPRDASRVEHLAQVGVSRLLLVDPSVEPPTGDRAQQDWLPSPAKRDDIHDRVVRLSRVSAERHASACQPMLDQAGHLSFVDSCVELPACVRPLAEMLVSHFGRPVSRQALLSGDQSEQGEQREQHEQSVQREAPSSLSKLQARASRLCQCINPLGLEVAAAAGDTYVMRRCAA
jgi:hypothetical protein